MEATQPADPPTVSPCPLCSKTFAKESSRKRHIYYCRSKQSQAPVSRRRSCLACIRAKTRCQLVDENGGRNVCSRCHERAIECTFPEGTLFPTAAADAPSSSATSTKPLTATSSSNTATVATAAAAATATITSVFPANSHDLVSVHSTTVETTSTSAPSAPGAPTDDEATFNTLDEFVNVQFLRGSEAIHLNWRGVQLTLPQPEADWSGLFPPSISAEIALSTVVPLFGGGDFSDRPLRRPEQAPTVALLRQLLMSYPYRMLRKETFPPFINSLLFSWAEVNRGPPLQALINCVSLIHMFKATTTNTNFTWKMIDMEQDRIRAEMSKMDRWELLASQQALLIYSLLWLSDKHRPHILSQKLLETAWLASQALAVCTAHEKCFEKMEEDIAGIQWLDWLFHESRVRTIEIFRIFNMIVDISALVSCSPMEGFSIIPLACNGLLWQARSPSKWRAELTICYPKRTIHGLSKTGTLIRLEQNQETIVSTPVAWESWTAEMDEMGTLAMIAGSLMV